MFLNIDSKGNIGLNGQVFPFSTLTPKQRFASKPHGVTAQQIPCQFTFDTGSGIQVYAAGSWLVERAPETFAVMSPTEFQAQYEAAA